MRSAALPPQIERVVELTLAEPPGEATHWTGRAMAAATGISLRSAADLGGARPAAASGAPVQAVARSRLAAKLRDVVGLYLDPPAHSLVLSVDEKSQIQVLDRSQPGLPMKKGRAETMTHDYIRHGTTTLFAVLNVLDGTVIGQCMARHRHQARLLPMISMTGAACSLLVSTDLSLRPSPPDPPKTQEGGGGRCNYPRGDAGNLPVHPRLRPR